MYVVGGGGMKTGDECLVPADAQFFTGLSSTEPPSDMSTLLALPILNGPPDRLEWHVHFGFEYRLEYVVLRGRFDAETSRFFVYMWNCQWRPVQDGRRVTCQESAGMDSRVSRYGLKSQLV